MAKFEIEAPTEGQKAEADVRELISFAETGVSQVEIISRLVSQGVPIAEAKKILPKILKGSGKRRRGEKFAALVLATLGFGIGIVVLIAGFVWFWAFVTGFFGVGLYINFNRKSDR